MKLSTDWRKEIQTIPNLLSIFRIFLLPIYLYFVLRQSFYIAGAVIVVIDTTFSDFVDGRVSTVALAVVWSILDKRRLYVCSWINRAI